MVDIIPALSGAFKATSVGLQLPESKVSIERWLTYGKQLREVQGALRWCIGDWLNYGELKYGEMYSQGYALFPEYHESSIRHMRRVAEIFPVVRRRTSVTWSEHAEIASRPIEEQEQWLDELEMGMTRHDLRLALKDGNVRQQRPHCPTCTCAQLVDKDKLR